MCPVTRFFAVETNLSFWWDLESFDKKVWPVTHFFRSTDYLKFLMGLRKVSTKRCDQLHGSNAVETHLSFWWDLENFDKMLRPVALFWQYRLSQVFGWHLEKIPQKCVPSYTFFFAVETISCFWWDLEKFRQKGVTSYTVLTLWRLT